MPFAQKVKKLSGATALTLTASYVQLPVVFDVADRDKLTLSVKYTHNSATTANQLQVALVSQPSNVDEDFDFTNAVDGTNDTLIHAQHFEIDPVDRDGVAVAAGVEIGRTIAVAINEGKIKVLVKEIVNSAGAGTVEIWGTAGYTSG